MPQTIKDIKDLIAAGDTGAAAKAALEYAEVCNDVETIAGLSTISNSLEQQNHLWSTGQLSNEEFLRANARAAFGLSSWVSSLPEQAKPRAAQKRMEEGRFKWRIFIWLIASKLLVLLFTFYLWRTRGFTNDEAWTAFSALLPAFVAYISLMIKDFAQVNENEWPAKRYAPARLVTIAWWLFPIYTLAQAYIVYLKVTGSITFAQMTVAIAGVESVLGGYIGDIVTSLFKK